MTMKPGAVTEAALVEAALVVAALVAGALTEAEVVVAVGNGNDR